MHLSCVASLASNATVKDPNQAGCPCKNSFETGPAERQINRRHCQRITYHQPNSSTWNQSAAY
jgi:hypothetical protein